MKVPDWQNIVMTSSIYQGVSNETGKIKKISNILVIRFSVVVTKCSVEEIFTFLIITKMVTFQVPVLFQRHCI